MIKDRGGPVCFGHVGARFRAYFGHGDAFRARVKHCFVSTQISKFRKCRSMTKVRGTDCLDPQASWRCETRTKMKLKQPLAGIKYARDKRIVQFERIFSPKVLRASIPWSEDVARLTIDGVLLCKLTWILPASPRVGCEALLQ